MGNVGGREDEIVIRRCALIDVERSLWINMPLGPDAADMISSMAMEGDAVWAAAGSHAIKYLRGKEVRSLFCCELGQ